MKVGETYSFRGESLIFVVIAETNFYRMSDVDLSDRPGFTLLVLDGSFSHPTIGNSNFVTKLPGTTFDIGRGSAIAVDSVRFPVEE